MAFDRFMIAPLNVGLETDVRPWLIPDDAFSKLENAYIFRGRVRKRFGEMLTSAGYPSAASAPLYSRLGIQVATTDGVGNAAGTVPGTIFAVGQQFLIDTEIFTVNITGTPAVMLTTGSSVTHTFNTTTGAFNFVGAAANEPVFFYSDQPVMGLTIYETGPANDQPAYAFDTQFAYTFNGSYWQRSGTGVTPQWHGNNLNFFWATNYFGTTSGTVFLFVTNFNATVGSPGANDDPLWYFDGTNWTIFTPYFFPDGGAPQTGPFVATARIIVAFKNRLLLLNTIENDGGMGGGTNTQYVNRCRYSAVGSPLSVNAWYEPNQSDSSGNLYVGGGFEDATTEEEIISAEFIKDRLIVFFERSTWELAYTGNEIRPFVWQKINTELGSEAQFSTVPFDKVILAIGNTGVHACNGANVERIDNRIPDQIFQIINKDLGVQRVAGIRDYYTEMVYWTFPSVEQNPNEDFPTKVLVYNYKNGAWAFNDDCITCFGYFEQQTDFTWQSLKQTWDSAAFAWNSGIQLAQFRQVIAGNQQGYIFTINADIGRNAPVMSITNLVNGPAGSNTIQLTVINHTLDVGNYVALENASGTAGITALNGQIFVVTEFIDINTVRVGSATIGGGDSYTGGGTLTRVSQINILSKQWNPYVNKGKNVYLARIDFGVMKTSEGEITVDYFVSSTEDSTLFDAAINNCIMGTGILETSPYALVPLEQQQDRLWHPLYFQQDGECVQLNIYLSADEMEVPAIAWSDFQLEGLVLHTKPTSERLQ